MLVLRVQQNSQKQGYNAKMSNFQQQQSNKFAKKAKEIAGGFQLRQVF